MIPFYKPHSLKQLVRVNSKDDTIDLISLIKNEITTMTFSEGEIVNETNETLIQIGHDDDRIKAASTGKPIYWYGSNYIAYGCQKIKNKEVKGKKKREVFYLKERIYN